MKKLVECVPNISEGNNQSIIKKIVEVVEKYPGIKLLNVDPGKATNRTVITFVVVAFFVPYCYAWCRIVLLREVTVRRSGGQVVEVEVLPSFSLL